MVLAVKSQLCNYVVNSSFTPAQFSTSFALSLSDSAALRTTLLYHRTPSSLRSFIQVCCEKTNDELSLKSLPRDVALRQRIVEEKRLHPTFPCLNNYVCKFPKPRLPVGRCFPFSNIIRQIISKDKISRII